MEPEELSLLGPMLSKATERAGEQSDADGRVELCVTDGRFSKDFDNLHSSKDCVADRRHALGTPELDR